LSRLMLERNRWYSWQMMPGYGARLSPYFSPILITAITPLRTGKSLLQLDFINALYAEGVQNFRITGRVLRHAPAYLVAELQYTDDGPKDRTAIIGAIDVEWVRRFCPGIRLPAELTSDGAEAELQQHLTELFGGTH
jgi:hypothetical protein